MSHWYTSEGSPLFEVPKVRGGGMRATTLRDARKLHLFPSVTTITHILASDGITRWKVDLAIECAFDGCETPEQAAAAFRERAESAAQRGEEIHDVLAAAVKSGETPRPPLSTPAIAVRDWLREQGATGILCEHPFASEALGFGGRVDLVVLAPGGTWVVDYKTSKRPKRPYFEDIMQLAAYRNGLGALDARYLCSDARCMVINIVQDTGETAMYTLSPHDLETAWECFGHLYEAWCIINRYDPRAELAKLATRRKANVKGDSQNPD